MLPLAYLMKDTKDIIFKTRPDPDRAIAYFQCNGMPVTIAQTVEENVAFAKINAKEQLGRLMWSFPVCAMWLYIIMKLESNEIKINNRVKNPLKTPWVDRIKCFR